MIGTHDVRIVVNQEQKRLADLALLELQEVSFVVRTLQMRVDSLGLNLMTSG